MYTLLVLLAMCAGANDRFIDPIDPTSALGKRLTVKVPAGDLIHSGMGYAVAADVVLRDDITLRFAFPMDGHGQHVDDKKLEAFVVDREGQDVDCIKRRKVSSQNKRSELALTLDHRKLPREFYVRWSVPVTHDPEEMFDFTRPIPLPKLGELPAETKQWLGDEPMLRIKNPEIQALAKQIRAQSRNLQELVWNTQAALAVVRDKGRGKPFEYRFDAPFFLQTGIGSCTSNTHLFAALMRANGIPCGMVSGVLRGIGQDQHWQAEYYVPGQGWARTEPQNDDLQISRKEMPTTGVVITGEPESNGRQYFSDWFGHVDGLRSKRGLLVDDGKTMQWHYYAG